MQISSLKLYRSMQCIACVCNFKVRNLIVRCDLKKYHFTMGSCSTPGSTTWWSRQFYWDKIQSNPRSPWYIWWFFRENLTFWGIFKVQFVLPSSIFVSFTSHRSRRCALSFLFYLFLSMFRKLGPRSGFTRSCGFSSDEPPKWSHFYIFCASASAKVCRVILLKLAGSDFELSHTIFKCWQTHEIHDLYCC